MDMSCVENTLDIFEKKFSLYVVMAVKENPGSTKTEILRLDKGNEKTKFFRINELIAEGIIVVNDERKKYNEMRLYLTPKGQEIAIHLEKIQQIVTKN